jgi:hypothetical protein
MTLAEAAAVIQYDSNWGIWASLDDYGKFAADSQARYGQRCFENGGMIDEFRYFANGETIQNFLLEDGDIDDLIENINLIMY